MIWNRQNAEDAALLGVELLEALEDLLELALAGEGQDEVDVLLVLKLVERALGDVGPHGVDDLRLDLHELPEALALLLGSGDHVEVVADAEVLLDVAGTAHDEQPALGEDADAVGQVVGLVQVVRAEDDRPVGGAQLEQHLPNAAPDLRVEAYTCRQPAVGSSRKMTSERLLTAIASESLRLKPPLKLFASLCCESSRSHLRRRLVTSSCSSALENLFSLRMNSRCSRTVRLS